MLAASETTIRGPLEAGAGCAPASARLESPGKPVAAAPTRAAAPPRSERRPIRRSVVVRLGFIAVVPDYIGMTGIGLADPIRQTFLVMPDNFDTLVRGSPVDDDIFQAVKILIENGADGLFKIDPLVVGRRHNADSAFGSH